MVSAEQRDSQVVVAGNAARSGNSHRNRDLLRHIVVRADLSLDPVGHLGRKRFRFLGRLGGFSSLAGGSRRFTFRWSCLVSFLLRRGSALDRKSSAGKHKE